MLSIMIYVKNDAPLVEKARPACAAVYASERLENFPWSIFFWFIDVISHVKLLEPGMVL